MAGSRWGASQDDLTLILGAGTVASLNDEELLERFIDRHEAAEAAFEAIVRRHGPMVQGVCRSLLPEAADADDAFQATFLVLIRKARSVRIKDSLRPWLYGVSWRVARKMQTMARRRQHRETSGVPIDQTIDAPPPEPSDLLPILIEEIDRLPARYQAPVVLCHLQGLTHEQVAGKLGCPVGTVSSRLSRGRSLLRSRLARRGLGLPVATITAAFASREVLALSPALVRATARASLGGVVSAQIRHLTEGVIASMIANKLKLAGSLLLAGSVSVGVAAGRFPTSGGQQAAPKVAAGSIPEPLTPPPTAPGGAVVAAAPTDQPDRPKEEAAEPMPPPAPIEPAQAARTEPAKAPRAASVEAPALTGITIDGDLKDWPAAMPRYAIKNLMNLAPYYGFNGLQRADFSTSADLSAAFSVGYDPNEQVIYLAVIVRDDKPIIGNTEFWDTDSVEVFVDGRHTNDSLAAFPPGKTGQTLDAADLPLVQYIGIPGVGRVYGVRESAGQPREADNPILMFGDIHRTKSRMAYRRDGDVTTYEWQVQAFDHYPDQPTSLVPFKRIGFDVAVVDKDKPATTDGPSTEPEADRSAWVSWSPVWQGPAFLHADRLGEIVLGKIP